MKKSKKLFLAGATLVLGVATFFAAHANNKKVVGFTTAVTNISGSIQVLGNFTTVASHGKACYFATAGAISTPVTLVTKVNKVKKAYLL